MYLTRHALLSAIIVLCTVTHVISQNALQFDGTNDFVQLANRVNVGTNNFTFEVWVNPASSVDQIVFAQDISGDGNSQFRLSTLSTQKAEFTFSNTGSSITNQVVTANNSVPTGVWTHIAVVRNSTTITIYINGTSGGTSTTALIDNQSGADANKPFRIGARGPAGNTTGQNNFNGMIDDFRYWNVARTAAQIQANILQTPAVDAANLVWYYKFDEGSGTTLNNLVTAVTNTATLNNSPTWIGSPVKFNANAIDLDGSNDYISIGAPLSSNASFTKEAWVYLSPSASGANNIISSNNSPLWINSGFLNAGVGGYSNVVDPVAFTKGSWVHVAVTFDDATNTMVLYKNGTAVHTNTSVTASYTSENIFIGSHTGGNSLFPGVIDEVRIWNTARSQAQIQANMNTELNPSAEANLVVYYTFNQGITSGTNTGLTTLVDQKANFHGTLNNFALSGSTSNYVTQALGLTVLPLRWDYVTASAQSNGIMVKWATASEQNTKDFTVQHSIDGVHWNVIASLPAAGNSATQKLYSHLHLQPTTGANYYRILQKDIDGKSSYSKVLYEDWSLIPKAFIIKNTLVTDGVLQVQVNQPITLSIYTMQGKLVWKKQLATGKQMISLSGYAKGLYLLKGKNLTERIAIE